MASALTARVRREPRAVDPHALARPAGYHDDDRRDVLALLPSEARTYLDVGAGTGAFGRLLRAERAVEYVAAVESEPLAADWAHYDAVFRTTFPLARDQVAGLPPVDCVVFNDVLEHMGDPWAALRQARSVLAPGGSVVASIPNVHNLATLFDLIGRGDWPYSASGVLDVDHVRFFTRRSAFRLFESCAFSVEEVLHLDPLPLPAPCWTLGKPLLDWRSCGYRRIGFRARARAGGPAVAGGSGPRS